MPLSTKDPEKRKGFERQLTKARCPLRLSLIMSLIPTSLPLTQKHVHYLLAGKWQSKPLYSMLPFSNKLLTDKRHLFTMM